MTTPKRPQHPSDPRPSAPEPIPSPTPPAIGEDESPSGSHYIPATRAELRDSVQHVEKFTLATTEQQTKTITKFVSAADVKWFLGTIVVIIAGTAATIAWGSGAMDKKVDAGIAPIVKELAEHKVQESNDVAELKTEVKELRTATQINTLKTERTETMVQMLVENRGMTPPPPVVAPKPEPPRDAGR